MSGFTIVRTAVLALRRNMLRTILTMLSLMIGVAAVIAIGALGSGARRAIEAGVESAGTNMIVVSAGNWTTGGVRLGMGSSSTLTRDDADAIRGSISGAIYVSGAVRTRQQLINGGQNWSATVEGVGIDLPRIRYWPLANGVFFSLDHVQRAAKVCVIGTVVRDTLFTPGTDPVGQSIRIGPQIFRIVGVLAPKGQSAAGQDQDDAVFVPVTTAQKKLMGVTYLRNIFVSASSVDDVAGVAEGIRRLLRVRHAIPPGAPDDFRVRTLEEIAALRTRTTRTMTTLLALVAGVSLFVGGIGVMNIMLVSVAERTREIGIRLAVGARPRDVRRQFLTEALLLSAAGGAVGLASGAVIARGLTLFVGWPTEIPPTLAAAAIGLALIVGVFFGWYPASRAAAVDPIDALRFE